MENVKKNIQNTMRYALIVILLLLAFIALIFTLLSKHLLEVQIDERFIHAASEKNTFVFTYETNEDEFVRPVFDDEEYHYYFYGIKQAYISFGSTKTTFQDAIIKDYTSIETILDGCVREVSKDHTNYYVHVSQKKEEYFKVAIRTEKNEEGDVEGYHITLYPGDLDLTKKETTEDTSLESEPQEEPQP